MTRALLAAVLLIGAVAAPAAGAGETPLVHGADSVLVTPDAIIVWGVLRAPAEDDAQIVIRIAAPGRTGRVSVEAVDPFSRERRAVASPRSLGGDVDIRRRRVEFADFPRLEIHLKPEGSAPERAELTIFYLGVPDTTPEFASEAALLNYLEQRVRSARGNH